MDIFYTLQNIFDHVTKGLTGSNEEKIRQAIDNLDLLPLDLEPFKEIATFEEYKNILRVSAIQSGRPCVFTLHLPELPIILERFEKSRKSRTKEWKILDKRSSQLQKEYLEIQNRLMLDDPETFEKEIISDLEKETQQFESQSRSNKLRGHKSCVSDILYLLRNVIPQ